MAVLEHALLPVRSGEGSAFEAAMTKARPLIAASPGFISLQIRPPTGTGQPYLLLVEWESLADHRDGFRQSGRYRKWRALLHHFYDPIPGVSYFGEPL
ncbi:antibiotic biosynthesis monooxygenase family protein [Sphingopyxis sp. MWB1]|uniref:antibiotic biosynthesis monooxygenase family protein n=1 Tax=Sphingopyxis sp. MWB1 TaxID=1537715 RepID=UPI00051A29D2|nr:antibiotic biosynthesis monooxygenase [Sphingopyxis sp. MWB1]